VIPISLNAVGHTHPRQASGLHDKVFLKKKKVYMTKIHRIILQMLPILANIYRESQSVGDYYSTCRTIQPTFL